MSKDHIIKIYEDEPVLQAFKLMRRKRIGGIPIVEMKSEKPVGNISIRDVHFLLTAPDIYHDYSLLVVNHNEELLSGSERASWGYISTYDEWCHRLHKEPYAKGTDLDARRREDP
ncbi:unnamed protein product [Thlaspi arvense]|uniref:CBS domain-containing protein n=1 Tax=Thlaspi arvense TaxID=13288 RepID=A0AAU9SSD3_THLAR|nr:unnamed protein product [Thlaspi arvense]